MDTTDRSVCASLCLLSLCLLSLLLTALYAFSVRSVCDGCGCGYLLRFYQPTIQPTFKANLRMSIGILRLIKSVKLVGLAGFILFLPIHPHIHTRHAEPSAPPFMVRGIVCARSVSVRSVCVPSLQRVGRVLPSLCLRSLWLRSLYPRSLCLRPCYG